MQSINHLITLLTPFIYMIFSVLTILALVALIMFVYPIIEKMHDNWIKFLDEKF